MTSAAYPTVYAALVAVADAALSVRVVDGYDVSEDPGDVVMIGVPNIGDTTAISAGSFTQTMLTHGATGAREEDGTINGVALAWNGDGDASAARVAAFGYVDALAAAIRLDPKLGISAFESKAFLSAGEVLEDQVDGATTAVSFTVAYKALI